MFGRLTYVLLFNFSTAIRPATSSRCTGFSLGASMPTLTTRLWCLVFSLLRHRLLLSLPLCSGSISTWFALPALLVKINPSADQLLTLTQSVVCDRYKKARASGGHLHVWSNWLALLATALELAYLLHKLWWFQTAQVRIRSVVQWVSIEFEKLRKEMTCNQ